MAERESKPALQNSAYRLEELCPSVYAIDDRQEESMYLVCGRERALMIDTGSNGEPLTPLIRSLWDGPVALALTHAHFDHMYHWDEFSEVSLHNEDIAAWNKVLRPVVWISSVGSGKKPKRYPMESCRPLREGDTIPLGGKELVVIHAKGHTPGSVIFADEADRLLFTGDAFGSGSYAWMWMPGCSCLGEYRQSLRELLVKLRPYEGYTMLGGHRKQSQLPGANPLSLSLVEDMERLCTRILDGSCQWEAKERNFGFTTYTYRWGQAALVLRKNKIC